MAKTHEALLKAEKENKVQYLEPKREAERALAPLSLTGDLAEPAPEWCKELKSRIQTQYPKNNIKTILFTGTSSGNGSTSTAAGFAVSLAKTYQHKVLLVDVNLRTPGIHKIFNSPHAPGLVDVFNRQYPSIDTKVLGNLYIITCNEEYVDEINGFFGSNRFDDFLKKMREKFDYVILDGPPVIAYSESRLIGAKVDGVILILDCGTTRRRVAMKAKQEIKQAGGKLLGVVLNKREYCIPDWLYKRL
jgi:capsular exopolysaccharide synthesis family protein